MNEESFRDPSTGNQAATIGSLLSSRGRLLRAVARGAAFGFAAAGTLARAAFAPASTLPGGGAMGAGLTFFPAGSTPFFAEAAAFPESFAALAGFGVFDGFEAFAGFEAFVRAVFADFAREAALATFPFFAGCRPAFPETFLRTGAGGLRETGLAAAFFEVVFFEAFTLERDAFAAFFLPFAEGLDDRAAA